MFVFDTSNGLVVCPESVGIVNVRTYNHISICYCIFPYNLKVINFIY